MAVKLYHKLAQLRFWTCHAALARARHALEKLTTWRVVHFKALECKRPIAPGSTDMEGHSLLVNY